MAHGPGAAAALYPHAPCRPGGDLASSRGRGRPASTSISCACGSRFTGTPCCRCARSRCWLLRPPGQRRSTAQPRVPTVILSLSATRASPLTGAIPARSAHARTRDRRATSASSASPCPKPAASPPGQYRHNARCEGLRPRLVTMAKTTPSARPMASLPGTTPGGRSMTRTINPAAGCPNTRGRCAIQAWRTASTGGPHTVRPSGVAVRARRGEGAAQGSTLT